MGDLAQRSRDCFLNNNRTIRLARRTGEHWVKDLLECHDMRASLPHAEEITVTRPVTIRKRYLVIIIAAMKAGLQLAEGNALWLLRIAPCLVDLADEVRVH